ncbi:MAG: acyltransferase [Alphaproteobacteria bacterium]|nr:acyltransferase [Alphaproteobacteria bacterium]
MTNALSFYLDILRFGAAFAVFISHYAIGRISGGLFWQFDFGRTAVLAFFVLSGFVIAWVSETRERTLEEYALSRIARLYSVIIPAFILTALLNWLGKEIDPRSYAPELAHSTSHPVLDYALSAIFLGESWTTRVLPGFNVPYWSLNYEAWYYVLFAAAVFLRGRLRMAALASAAALAGPRILCLLPVWLMGSAAWQWRAQLPHGLGWPVVIACVAGLIALQSLGGQQLFWHPSSEWLPPSFSAYDYIVGVLFAVLIAGLANVQLQFPGKRVESVVRGIAGASFGLYLLHYPLLNFFGAVVPGPPSGALHRVLVFGLALGGALGIASLIEPRKSVLKRQLRSGLHLLLGKPPPSAVARQRLS